GARVGRLIDASLSEVFVLDAQTLRCIYANRGALDDTGRSLAELRAMEFVALYPDLDRNAFVHDMQALKKALRQRVDFESTCRRKDGSTYISRGSLQYHPGEDAPVISAICDDVTEHKRIGRELQRYVDGLTTIIGTQQDVSSESLDLTALLRVIAVRAKEITRATGAIIEMLEGELLVYRAATDETLSRIGAKVPLAGSLAGLSIREGRALRCNETTADPRVDRESCLRIGARSLVTAPIYRDGKPAGALVVFGTAPHAFTDQTVQLLQLLAGTLGAAMQRKHAEQAILAIARTASIETGRDFFKILVTELAGMVNAQFVFIGELSAANRQSMRLVAVHGSAENREGLEFPLEGLLAEPVLKDRCRLVASGVKRDYPDDALLRHFEAEGYVGLPLSGDDRTVIGVLGAMFSESIAQPDKVESSLQVFAARAAAELVRQRAERNLREQTGVLQSVLDSIADGVIVADPSGHPFIVNPAARRMAGIALRDEVPVEARSEYYGLYRADSKTL
ncbi:MAG: GAF domain-containing protein, partial [Burkholderiales bacterium]